MVDENCLRSTTENKNGFFLNKISLYFSLLTGHQFDEIFHSFDDFTKFMHKPVDGSSLGVGRMLFGLMMLLDIPEERSGSVLDLRWGESRKCDFPLFPFILRLSVTKMGILYAVMWVGALGITLGYKFKLTCTMFVIPYWYIFLLDKSSWNNHSYLYGLIGLIFLTTEANRYCALDCLLHRGKSKYEYDVPFWNYFILKFQFFILYFIAGMKKMCAEWLSGYAMVNLSTHWIFAPFRIVLGSKLTDLLIIHWFGAFFDLTVTFFLIYESTRLTATLFASSFHLMNSRLFSIGMFPWVCLVELPLFFQHDWPKYSLNKISFGLFYKEFKYKETIEIKHKFLKYENKKSKSFMLTEYLSTKSKNQCEGKRIKDDFSIQYKQEKKTEKQVHIKNNTVIWLRVQEHFYHILGFTMLSGKMMNKEKQTKRILGKNITKPHHPTATRRQKLVTSLMIFYCGLQLFLPYSHFITKGYNNWTNGLYGYSWDMMVHAWDTILVAVKVIDNTNGKFHFLEPYAYTKTHRWTQHADMAIQYAKCIKSNLLKDSINLNYILDNKKNSKLLSQNISIYFDVWSSLNGRFQQRFYNPKIDMLKAKWSPFETAEWVLPLLKELTIHRPKLDEITDDILTWNNNTDVMFIADFPLFSMDNYISSNMDNVTLTILDGKVKYEEEDSNRKFILTPGQYVNVSTNLFHKITTISDIPSCYMYTFINKTGQPDEINVAEKPFLPLLKEMNLRYTNYKRFFAHICDSLMFEIYKTPLRIFLIWVMKYDTIFTNFNKKKKKICILIYK